MKLFMFINLLFLLACAKPHYVDGLEAHIQGVSEGCELYFEKEDLCLLTKWETIPDESNFGRMTLKFYDKHDPTRLMNPRNNLHLVLWMPGMGHGSSPVTISNVDIGTYTASDIFFIMPGIWEIRYQLKDGNDVIEQIIQNITI